MGHFQKYIAVILCIITGKMVTSAFKYSRTYLFVFWGSFHINSLHGSSDGGGVIFEEWGCVVCV